MATFALASIHIEPRAQLVTGLILASTAPLLIDVLLRYRMSLTENEMHQIVHALDVMLFRERDQPEFGSLMDAVARQDLGPILREVSAVSPQYENPLRS